MMSGDLFSEKRNLAKKEQSYERDGSMLHLKQHNRIAARTERSLDEEKEQRRKKRKSHQQHSCRKEDCSNIPHTVANIPFTCLNSMGSTSMELTLRPILPFVAISSA